MLQLYCVLFTTYVINLNIGMFKKEQASYKAVTYKKSENLRGIFGRFSYVTASLHVFIQQKVIFFQQKAIDMFLLAADPTGENIFWIGLSDLFHEGKFVWSSTGQETTFTNWFQEPDNFNQNEHFVHIFQTNRERK